MNAVPVGLMACERAWIEARAAHVGGLTAAFRHLVRLAILHDAVVATSAAAERLEHRLTQSGLRPPEVEARLDAWAQRRPSWPLAARFFNLMTWQRPSSGGHGDSPEDDPDVPLPEHLIRRLIAEGRPVVHQ